ncbi:hypothetical protein, partial [Methyloceanibacter sp.]|uniref:hypothetical protein n=1 Tax=Methyloceanibacter sp. TaxID=1965321 RepID=UPI00351B3C23
APLMGLHAADDRSDRDNGGSGRHDFSLRHGLLPVRVRHPVAIMPKLCSARARNCAGLPKFNLG